VEEFKTALARCSLQTDVVPSSTQSKPIAPSLRGLFSSAQWPLSFGHIADDGLTCISFSESSVRMWDRAEMLPIGDHTIRADSLTQVRVARPRCSITLVRVVL